MRHLHTSIGTDQCQDSIDSDCYRLPTASVRSDEEDKSRSNQFDQQARRHSKITKIVIPGSMAVEALS